MDSVHGDGGGGDEADAADAPHLGGHLRPQHDDRPDLHPVREARHHPRPQHGPPLPHPAGEPHRLRHPLHDRLRRPLRPPLRPLSPRHHRNPRGISLHRMSVGFFLQTIIMLVASFTERHRLAVAIRKGIYGADGQVPLTILVLLPQFVLMGVADSFLEVAKLDFFYDQAPQGMKSLGTSYAMTNLGVGNFLSSFLLSTTAKVSKRNGHKGWIVTTSMSPTLTITTPSSPCSILSTVFFLWVCKMYVSRAELSEEVVAGDKALVAMSVRRGREIRRDADE